MTHPFVTHSEVCCNEVMQCLAANYQLLFSSAISGMAHKKNCVVQNSVISKRRIIWALQVTYCVMLILVRGWTHTRAVWKVSVHFEYLENWSCGLDVTWHPVRGDLTVRL